MRAARVALIALGTAVLAFGAWTLVTTVSPHGLFGLATWLAAAVVLHDAILSPLAWTANWVLRRAGRRIPGAVFAVVQVAIVLGVVFTLIVLPEIQAKHLGPHNPSVLPFDYGLRLGLLWAVLAVAAVVASLVALRLGARRTSRLVPRAVP